MPYDVVVLGLKELQSSLKAAPEKIDKGLRRELQAAAKPVKQEAQTLALASISHLGGPWSRFRIGISGGGKTIYLAPSSRRKAGSPRPNLAPLLLHGAMEPAVERNADEAVAKIEAMVDRVLSE